MTGGWRGALTALAVVGLVMTGAPPTAQAADCAGVTVVVDFRSLGGGVRTGCAAGDPSSGTAALTGAGFGYTFAARQPGFVCRINGLPASDPCGNAAPLTAYWAYWHGQPGGAWTYSNTSASAYDPAPGSVEGWSFGAGEQPGIAPPAPAPVPQPPQPQPPAPQPGQPAPQPGQPAPQPGQPGQPGQPTQQPVQSETPAPTTTAETSVPASSETTPSSTASVAPTSTTSVAVEPTAGTSSGGTVGLVAGIVVIAGLAGLGVWTARRRARAAE